jgi:hypothetical protein
MQSSDIRVFLKKRMFDDYMAVSMHKNVVIQKLNELSKDKLLYILSQYSQFPRNIVSVLVSAAYTFGYHGWTKFADELRENVFEELGGGSGHITSEFGPHYSILRSELQRSFGIDVSEYSPSAATETFLASMSRLVQSEPMKAAGGVFALEASAVPELGIVSKFVKHLAALHEVEVSRNLSRFFRFHMNQIEVGHRDRLIALCEDRLSEPTSLPTFIEGFDLLLQAMDVWWVGMLRESLAERSVAAPATSF